MSLPNHVKILRVVYVWFALQKVIQIILALEMGLRCIDFFSPKIAPSVAYFSYFITRRHQNDTKRLKF